MRLLALPLDEVPRTLLMVRDAAVPTVVPDVPLTRALGRVSPHALVAWERDVPGLFAGSEKLTFPVVDVNVPPLSSRVTVQRETSRPGTVRMTDDSPLIVHFIEYERRRLVYTGPPGPDPTPRWQWSELNWNWVWQYENLDAETAIIRGMADQIAREIDGAIWSRLQDRMAQRLFEEDDE